MAATVPLSKSVPPGAEAEESLADPSSAEIVIEGIVQMSYNMEIAL